MLVVTKVYDDKSAVLFDIDSMMSKRLTFEQIRHHDGPIIGVTSYNNEILEIKPMRIYHFQQNKKLWNIVKIILEILGIYKDTGG